MGGILFGTPSSQSPKAYDLANLQADQLATRFATGTTTARIANLLAAIRDNGFRYKIHPLETAAGLTDVNLTYGFDYGDIRRYGGSNNATAAANRTALLNALKVAAGADYGYGQPAFALIFPDAGTYNIASGGDIVVPVNCALLGASGPVHGVTLNFAGTDHLIFRDPYGQGGAQASANAYWPYFACGMFYIDVTGGYGVRVENYIGFVAQDCNFSSGTLNNPSLELRNSYGQWTERSHFLRCSFGAAAGDAILINGYQSNVNKGTTSFAYTTFEDCVVAVNGTANLVHILDGAVAYGIKWGFRGNFTSSGAMFFSDNALNGCQIAEGIFDIRVESGTGTSKLFNLQGGNFWNNHGRITLPSFDFDTIENATSFRGNYIIVDGVKWYHPYDAAIVLNNGADYETIIEFSTKQRMPTTLIQHSMHVSGQMTSAANAAAIAAQQVLGVLPTKGSQGMNRILRIEFNYGTGGGTPTPNPGGKWYIDFRKSVYSADIGIANLKEFYITDQNNGNHQAFNVDLDLTVAPFDATWTDIVMEALPTDVAYGSNNTGSGPSNVWCRVIGFA